MNRSGGLDTLVERRSSVCGAAAGSELAPEGPGETGDGPGRQSSSVSVGGGWLARD